MADLGLGSHLSHYRGGHETYLVGLGRVEGNTVVHCCACVCVCVCVCVCKHKHRLQSLHLSPSLVVLGVPRLKLWRSH